MISFLMAGDMGTLFWPTLTCVQRSRSPSGAPWKTRWLNNIYSAKKRKPETKIKFPHYHFEVSLSIFFSRYHIISNHWVATALSTVALFLWCSIPLKEEEKTQCEFLHINTLITVLIMCPIYSVANTKKKPWQSKRKIWLHCVYLGKHSGTTWGTGGLVRHTVDRHRLAVTGELQSEFFLPHVLDDMVAHCSKLTFV